MIVLYNPHVDDFLAIPPHFKYLKRRALLKYGHIFQGLMDEHGHVKIYADCNVSAFVPNEIFISLPRFIRSLFTNFELKLWMRANNLSQTQIIRISITDDCTKYTLFGFSYKNAQFDDGLLSYPLAKFGKVVLHLSHYFVASAKKSIYMRSIPNLYLAGDCDIRNNEYFKCYFSWYSNTFYVVPFSIGERFIQNKPYAGRTAAAVATGTFHNLLEEHPKDKYVDYITTTNLTTYHPVRKFIYENSDILQPDIFSYVTPYREYSRSRSAIKRFVMHINASQKKYFSIDIVELYNSFKLAIVGEEYTGFPVIGAIEAVACGAVLIGHPESLRSLGLIDNIHFIPFYGPINKLKSFVGAALQRNDLASISSEGAIYIKDRFDSRILFAEFKKIEQSNNVV